MNKILTIFGVIFLLLFIQCGVSESNSLVIEQIIKTSQIENIDTTNDSSTSSGLTLLLRKKTLPQHGVGDLIKFRTTLITDENTQANFKTPHSWNVSINENSEITPLKTKNKQEIWQINKGEAYFVNTTSLKIVNDKITIYSLDSSFKINYDISNNTVTILVDRGKILAEYTPSITIKDKIVNNMTKKRLITRNNGSVIITLDKVDSNNVFNSKKEAKNFFKEENKKAEKLYKTNSINKKTFTTKGDFVFVDGGTFAMGDRDGSDDEKPVHQVQIDGFWINKYEVSFAQYDEFCDETNADKPSDEGWGRGKHPVINVSWNDAVNYCNWLSQKEKLKPAYTVEGKKVTCDFSADGYRLPTEAEWEFAARGGNFTNGYDYSGSDNIDEVGWYSKNTNDNGTNEIGLKASNELGIYDMTGNALEWCWDWHAGYSKGNSSIKKNPIGHKYGLYKIVRGGAWDNNASDCRVSVRFHNIPNSNYYYGYGFRLVRTTIE